MTQRAFKLPDIGEGVTEGEIVQWFVRPGDRVEEDDPMVEVMTDKATVTIGAPCEGRVEALHFEVGSVAKVGQVILTLDALSEAEAETPAPPSSPAASAVGVIRDELPGAALFAESRPLAAPATRRLAKEIGVDIRRVPPSGPGGRVTPDDVRRAATGAREPGPSGLREERRPIAGVRRKIAERMREAKTKAAHFTFVEECDVSKLVALRARLEPEAQRRGVRLSYLPFVVKAVTDALRRHPVLNSAVDEQTNEIVYKRYYDIGIATATEAGLVVPVLRGADSLSILEIAERVDRLADSARRGVLSPEDLRGSTFTVTSLGKQSGLFATPILNYPEVGILGIHRIKERPVVREGQIVVGRVMLLSLSLDHRIVDGHVGAAFAYDVIEALENPERTFHEAL